MLQHGCSAYYVRIPPSDRIRTTFSKNSIDTFSAVKYDILANEFVAFGAIGHRFSISRTEMEWFRWRTSVAAVVFASLIMSRWHDLHDPKDDARYGQVVLNGRGS